MRRILFINTDMCAGGIEVSLLNLLDRLDLSKYDISLLLLSDNLSFLNRLPNEVHKILFSRNMEAYKKSWGGYCRRIIEAVFQKNKRNIVDKISLRLLIPFEEKLYIRFIVNRLSQSFDVVIAYRLGLSAKLASVLSGGIIDILFFHSGAIQSSANERKQLLQANHVVSVSEGIRQLLLHAYPQLSSSTIITIHNLINIKYIREQANIQSHPALLQNGTSIIVSCGRLVHEKGFDLLLNAMSLLKHRGENCVLIIVGGGDNSKYDKVLYHIAEDLGLTVEKDIFFVGDQKNPYCYMKMANIYVQPSRYEAFGLTIREAQVLGRPVIATKTVGANLLIRDGETGILCDPSPTSLAVNISCLMHNSEMCDLLSSNCLKSDFDVLNREALISFETLLQA